MKISNFNNYGISTNQPGFYNDPEFIRIEKEDPNFLGEYNRYVSGRKYDSEYLAIAEKKIQIITEVLYEELRKDGRKGACIDICQVLSKILEREGVWCCTFSGSLTIEFESSLHMPNEHYWTFDNGDFLAAHAWIFAPPFHIVDIAIPQQAFDLKVSKYVKDIVLEKKTVPAIMYPIDIINPECVPRDIDINSLMNYIFSSNPTLRRFVTDFPPVSIIKENTIFKYIPLHASASEGELEQITSISFSGKSPFAVYKDIILPKL